MPSPAPPPLTSRPLCIWLVDPCGDIPGEGTPPFRTWSLARVLMARGHEVTWWAATWSQRRKAIRTPPIGLREDEGFDVRLVAVRPYQKDASFARIHSQRDFGKTFERLAAEGVSSGQLSRPDIILACSPPLDAAEASLRLARTLDATFVLDLRDSSHAGAESQLPGPEFLTRLFAPLVFGNLPARHAALAAGADALSAESHACAATAFAAAPAETPRHVCYVGTYVDEFARPRAIATSEPLHALAEPAGSGGAAQPTSRIQGLFSSPTSGSGLLECVYAGSLEPGHGVETISTLCRQLSARGVAATIHVAGTVPIEANLRRAADAMTGSCRLAVHGDLTRRDYVHLLARCDIGLIAGKPGHMAAVPTAACEYAAAGLAIIHSATGELAEMIERHAAGVEYAARDAASLADAIAGLAADPKKLIAMRQAARRMAEAEFDREKTYPVFADWIETVAGGV
jgi:glycosyltransferase involved in cell wall biosynthesis